MKEIKFSIGLRDNIEKEKKSIFSKERGGILLGEENEDTIYVKHLIHLDNILENDNEYEYDINEANEIIENYHYANNKCNYLGEWHTHDNVFAIPSKEDIDFLNLRKKELKSNALMLILSKVEVKLVI